MNRNKRGIAVDLKSPQGNEIVKRLIERTDILIENFRLGTMVIDDWWTRSTE
ncbi:MAG TPA: CoA transferase [Chthoniobacterales bacterium]